MKSYDCSAAVTIFLILSPLIGMLGAYGLSYIAFTMNPPPIETNQ